MEGQPPESCIRECVGSIRRTRILRVEVSYREWEPGPEAGEINLMVKSLSLPSVDEIPVLASILASLTGKQINIFEYETIPISEARVTRLTRLINMSLASGRGIVLVAPSLLPISLISKLNPDQLEMLEDKLLLEATIEYSNILYLPEEADRIEIVAKRNSQSSYKRAEWLKREAEARGIRVTGIVSLEDNSEILKYVTRRGVESVYMSVPVTKIASLIVAISRCLGLGGIEVLEKRDSATHLVYALGINWEEARGIGRQLTRYEGALISDIWDELISGRVNIGLNTGCSRAIVSLYRALI